MKEKYLTEENITFKTKNWLRMIEPYSRRKKRFRIKPKNSALLVIDMQEYFLNKKSHAFLPAAKTIIPNIKNLIKSFRAKNRPVIFTYYALEKNEDPGIMGKWWSDVIREKSPFSKIIKPFKPRKGELVIRKPRYSAFQMTDLVQRLKKKRVKSVLITGVMTHLCCESTARDAFMKDFEVYFVIDATADQYEDLHLSSLKTLSDGFAIPVTTKEVLSCFKEGIC